MGGLGCDCVLKRHPGCLRLPLPSGRVCKFMAQGLGLGCSAVVEAEVYSTR